jgi:hypothetical protein
MKVQYRGFNIFTEKTACGVWYGAFKIGCGWELASGPSYETEASMVAILKERIDDYLENPGDYDHRCDRGRTVPA